MKKILTLVILHQGDKVLLGMKKRGFGVGKWNGFGGKVQDGETLESAARRELREESGIVANNLEKLGVLHFSWKNKEGILQVHIFKTTDISGQPRETEEMRPAWFKVTEIPFENMWADDKYWLPLFLENKQFQGTFIFDENNTVLNHSLHEI